MSTPDDPYAPRPADEPGGPVPPGPPPPAQPPPGPGSTGQPDQPGFAQPSPPPAQPGYPQPGYAPPGYAPPGAPGPGYPPPGQAPPGAPYPPPRKTNGLAIAALVCALAGFVTCISAPVGIVLGAVALSQIKRTGEDGRGLALAGVWIGSILTALAVIGLVVLIAFGAWFAGEVSDIDQACQRSDYATEQAYQDCLQRELEDNFGIN